MFECKKIFPIEMIPYEPVRVEWGIPYFSKLRSDLQDPSEMEDVEYYGLPDLWGILNYHVIDCKDISCPLSLEFEDEKLLMEEGRNIHRYVRYMRFSKRVALTGLVRVHDS